MADDTTSDRLGDDPERPGQDAPSGQSTGVEGVAPPSEGYVPKHAAASAEVPETPLPGAPSDTAGKPIPYFSSASGYVAGLGDAAAADAETGAPSGGPAGDPAAAPKKAGLFGFLKRDKKPVPESVQPAETVVAPAPAQTTEVAWPGSPAAATTPQPDVESEPENVPELAPPAPEPVPGPLPAPAPEAPSAQQPAATGADNSDAATVAAASAAAAFAAAAARASKSAAGAAPAGAAPVALGAPLPAVPPAVPAVPPLQPFIPAEKPSIFGFLRRNKTPEPAPGPWLPPEQPDAVAPEAGFAAAGTVAAGTAAPGVAAAGAPVDLGMTQPGVPVPGPTAEGAAPAPNAALSAAVAASAVLGAEATPRVDPAASQMTQMLPTIPQGAVAVVAPPSAPLPALGPMVPTGSRVIVVISRAASPVPVGPGVVVPQHPQMPSTMTTDSTRVMTALPVTGSLT